MSKCRCGLPKKAITIDQTEVGIATMISHFNKDGVMIVDKMRYRPTRKRKGNKK